MQPKLTILLGDWIRKFNNYFLSTFPKKNMAGRLFPILADPIKGISMQKWSDMADKGSNASIEFKIVQD